MQCRDIDPIMANINNGFANIPIFKIEESYNINWDKNEI